MKNTLSHIVTGATLIASSAFFAGAGHSHLTSKQINCDQYQPRNIHYASNRPSIRSQAAYQQCKERKDDFSTRAVGMSVFGIGIAASGALSAYELREDNT